MARTELWKGRYGKYDLSNDLRSVDRDCGYMMSVNRGIEDDPDAKPAGTYELVVKFTFSK